MGFLLRLISKVIILFLAIYCISVIIGFFAGYSVTFPFSFTEGRYVPEQRLHAIRLAALGTFFYFSLYYLFFGNVKLYPIQFLDVYLKSLTVCGMFVFYSTGVELREYYFVLFFLIVSTITHFASRNKIRSYFN